MLAYLLYFAASCAGGEHTVLLACIREMHTRGARRRTLPCVPAPCPHRSSTKSKAPSALVPLPSAHFLVEASHAKRPQRFETAFGCTCTQMVAAGYYTVHTHWRPGFWLVPRCPINVLLLYDSVSLGATHARLCTLLSFLHH